MKYQIKKEVLYFYFEGEMDFVSIDVIKEEVIDVIEKSICNKIIFDFEKVSFVDSSGIGFVLARYRELKKKERELYLANLSRENRIIFDMSGIFQIIRLIENEVKL